MRQRRIFHQRSERRKTWPSTAAGVKQALGQLGYFVRCVPFAQQLTRLAQSLRNFDVVFNLAESPFGCYEKEPHAAAFLELLGIPYTGNGPISLLLCKNKARTKQLLQAHGVATPRFCVCRTVPRQRLPLSFPLVVKPLCQDGSIGITDGSVVRTMPELRRAVGAVRRRQQQDAIAEEFLSGREFNVSVLGNGTSAAPYRVLPPGEYVYHSPRWRLCTFDAKWDEQHPAYAAVEAVCPARIAAPLQQQLARMALSCARIFELTGYARLDFRLDATGQPQVFDINPNPDITPRMGIARSAEAAGLAYHEFLSALVRFGISKGAR
ncbi:MAG: ATP-grasp domain-containing protein [Verrucomicrobiota bacterium]